MKKNLMKKVFAVSLSIAMACSFIPATNPVTASAAAPYVGLRTTFKTLKVNQSTKMTLKNNTLNWQITRVTTSNKPIATVYGKDKKAATFYIKGKSVGRATIKAYLKTSKRKTKNTKTVSCRVNVIADGTDTPTTPSVTETTVKTQAELDAAIKAMSETGSGITKLTIAPDAAENFTIPTGTFLGVDLVVNAPNSDVTNNATFKSIEIQAIKDSTWFENGTGNTIRVLAEKARIVVNKGSSVKGITFGRANADVKLVVNGKVEAATISAKMKLDISGEATTEKMPITIGPGAADTELTSSIPLEATADVNVKVTFSEGAEGSTIKITVKDVEVVVTNNTKQPIVVTKADNTLQNVAIGATSSVSTPSTPTPGTTTPGTSTPGTSTTTKGSIDASLIPSVSNLPAQGSVSVSPTSVTAGSFTLTISAADLKSAVSTISSGAFSLEYRVSYGGAVGSFRDLEDEIVVKGVPYGTTSVDVSIEYRIKESADYKASDIKRVTYRVTIDTAHESGSATKQS